MKIYGGDVDPFVASVTYKHSGIKIWDFLIPKITLEILDLALFVTFAFLYSKKEKKRKILYPGHF